MALLQFARIIGSFSRKIPPFSVFFITNCNRVNSETNFGGVALQMTRTFIIRRQILLEIAKYCQVDLGVVYYEQRSQHN